MTSPDGPNPKTFDQYEILENLAASRKGVSFKAKHRTMGRIVAIKMLTAEAAGSTQLMERFNRKVKILAALKHPNVVTAYEAGVHDGVPYVVTEFIDGYDLRELLKRFGPLPVAHAVGYVLQAAAGLGYAHSHGVCHRNVKPSNLMVDKQGVVKVIGMGLARLDAGEAGDDPPEREITQPGQIMGSCDFMAPEQAVDAHSVDPRADVYSLGCTLHALLTGKSPYAGKSPMQQVMAHRMAPTPSLRAVRADVPEALDAVFRKMLAKKAEDRYGSMAEVMTALERSMAPQGSPAQDAATQEKEETERNFNELLKSLGQEATAAWQPTPSQQARMEAVQEAAHPAGSQQAEARSRAPAGKAAARDSQAAARQRRVLIITVANLILGVVVVGIVLTRKPWSAPPPPTPQAKGPASKKAAANATLAIHWPESQREGGSIDLDGKRFSLPASGPIELQCSAGQRQLVLSRPSAEPYRETVKVGAGDKRTIAPVWKALAAGPSAGETNKIAATLEPAKEPELPKPAARAAAEATPEPNSVATAKVAEGKPAETGKEEAVPGISTESWMPSRSKYALPDEAAQTKAQRLVRETYREEFAGATAAAAKTKLATKLTQAAVLIQDDPAGRYVLLQSARELAADAGDRETAFAAIDRLADYPVDSAMLKADVLTGLARSARATEEHKTLAESAQAILDGALEAGQFQAAGRLARFAQTEASKSRDNETLQQARLRAREVERMLQDLAEAQKAAKALAEQPGNAEANLAVGWCECSIRGNWAKGLPMLKAGSDESLRTAAAKDLAEPTDPAAQVAVGDLWWDLAEKRLGLSKQRLQQRAVFWYRKAFLGVTGLLKNKIEKRIQAVEK